MDYFIKPPENIDIARGLGPFQRNGTTPASTLRLRGLFHPAIQAGAAQCIVRPRSLI